MHKGKLQHCVKMRVSNINTFLTYIFIFTPLVQCANYWTWKCTDNACIKERLKNNEKAVSLEVCELQCLEYSRVWPMPNGKFEMKKQLAAVKFDVRFIVNGPGSKLLDKMVQRFFVTLDKYTFNPNPCHDGAVTKLYLNITDYANPKLDLHINEGYNLTIAMNNSDPAVYISADTIFGARNGLETLSQLIVCDTVSKSFLTPTYVNIVDEPIYTIRGLLIDTARNYISLEKLKMIIEGMAVNKLNTFHWHITDSQSFPFVSPSIPELSELGAYAPHKVYTTEDISKLVEWAEMRGVRIVPEFDGPAHVGEGWQDSDLVVCFNKKPWGSFCKEPPCGQFDPTKKELYPVLQKIYKDMISAFNPVAFHFGGDEVTFDCWRSVESIRKWMTAHNMSWIWNAGHVALWNMYQNRSFNLLTQEAKRNLPGIIWTSALTDKENLHHLPRDKYIIHVWTDKKDLTIKDLIENDYRVIISNYDTLYLDCGFQSWVDSSGTNWCSPYSTWKKIYDNSPSDIINHFEPKTSKQHLIMGSIAALWTETVDDLSIENRIWPRAAALAERVWAEPKTRWSDAQYRLNTQRERMIKLGISVDTLIPEWCQKNQDSCR